MIARIARIYNLIASLAFGIFMVFFFDTFHRLYVPIRTIDSTLSAMINYPIQVQGGMILAFGVGALLQEHWLMPKILAHETNLAVLSLVATSLSFKADYQLWTALSATSIPQGEFSSFVYFQLSADGFGLLLAALTLLRLVDFKYLKWLMILIQGTFGFLLYFFTHFMMASSFSQGQIFAAIAPGMEIIAISWKLCAATMLAISLIMLVRSPYPGYTLVYGLSAGAHLLAYLYTPGPGQIAGAFPHMSLITLVTMAIGFSLNALASQQPAHAKLAHKKK